MLAVLQSVASRLLLPTLSLVAALLLLATDSSPSHAADRPAGAYPLAHLPPEVVRERTDNAARVLGLLGERPMSVLRLYRPWDHASRWGQSRLGKRVFKALRYAAPWSIWMGLAGGEHAGIIDFSDDPRFIGRARVREIVTGALETNWLVPNFGEPLRALSSATLLRAGALYDEAGKPVRDHRWQGDLFVLRDLVTIYEPHGAVDMADLRARWRQLEQLGLGYDFYYTVRPHPVLDADAGTHLAKNGQLATYCAREVRSSLRLAMGLADEAIPRPWEVGSLEIHRRMPEWAADAYYRERAADAVCVLLGIESLPEADPERSERIAQELLRLDPSLPTGHPKDTIAPFAARQGIYPTDRLLDWFEQRDLIRRIYPPSGFIQQPPTGDDALLLPPD